MSARSLGSRLLDLLYPPKCVFCTDLLPRDRYAQGCCARCESGLPRQEGRYARRMGVEFSVCYAPLTYEGTVRSSLRRYKFSGRSGYHRCYGRILRQCLEEQRVRDIDLITWVPLSRRHLLLRGYDQARLLAREAAKHFALSPIRLLDKPRNTRRQSSLTSLEREANVRNAYRLHRGADVTGKRILLVDDILTTGATLNACAAVLMQAGASEVLCLTLAKGAHPPKSEQER